MFESFHLFNTRRPIAPEISGEGLFGSRIVLLAKAVVMGFRLLFTYAPPFQRLFATRAIGPDAWIRAVLAASSVFVLVALEKRLVSRLRRPAGEPPAPSGSPRSPSR